MSAARRLHRNSVTGRIAGVCSGLADYLDADVAVIRLAWVILSIVPGGIVGGVVAYLAAWIIMPDSHTIGTESTTTRRLTRSRADRKIAGC